MNTVARVRDYSGLVAEFTIYLKEKVLLAGADHFRLDGPECARVLPRGKRISARHLLRVLILVRAPALKRARAACLRPTPGSPDGLTPSTCKYKILCRAHDLSPMAIACI